MKKQVYILSILLAILFFPFLSNAQTNYEDVVYLKNGSIIHGIIIEQVPNQTIKIQTRDGNVFVYKVDEIEKMTKEQSQKTKNSNTNFSDNEIKQSGFTNITEMNFGFGVGSLYKGESSWGMQTINGYLFNPNFSLGLGIGFDQYSNNPFIPIFADIRANFLKSKISPFFAGDIGYSFVSGGSNDGGLLINPNLGLKFFVTPKFALNFSIGYRIQMNSYKYSIYNGYSSYTFYRKETATFFSIKFGVTF